MFVTTQVLSHARTTVFDWHTRPGAMRRLTPAWQPVEVQQEAASLRDGVAVLAMPGGRRWVARHDPQAYVEGESFVDDLVSRPFVAPVKWRHLHQFTDEPDGMLLTDRVDTQAPEPFCARLFGYRHRQLAGDLAAHAWAAQLAGRPLRIGITGSSGTIGQALCAFLTSGGHDVVRLVRGPAAGQDERLWSPLSPDPRSLEGLDRVVHLAGASIAGRFTEKHKTAVRASRVEPTRRLALASVEAGVPVFVSASAIGFYGHARGDEVLAEPSGRGSGFLADVVADWEAAAHAASGSRVVLVRTGIVQAPRAGALGVQRRLFSAGLGGRIGDGQQWVSWIGIDDLLDVYLRAIVDSRLEGPVNAVAPRPVRGAEYAATLAHTLRRPAVLAVPVTAIKLMLGAEGAREVALASQRVLPEALKSVGHDFRHPDLASALAHLFSHPQVDQNAAD